MKNISLKLPETLLYKLEQQAATTGVTKSECVREAIEQYVATGSSPPKGSFLEAAGDLIGCVEGPGDLSYNPKYMEDFGR